VKPKVCPENNSVGVGISGVFSIDFERILCIFKFLSQGRIHRGGVESGKPLNTSMSGTDTNTDLDRQTVIQADQ